MNLRAANKTKLTLVLSADEAARLLATLQNHRDIVGDYGRDLVGKLVAAGVQAPNPPEHIRYEYMPPS